MKKVMGMLKEHSHIFQKKNSIDFYKGYCPEWIKYVHNYSRKIWRSIYVTAAIDVVL